MKGGGGGGGRPDNVDNQTAGLPGSMVTAVYPDTATTGTNLKIYVAGGGLQGSDTYIGAPGGFGYPAGRNGYDGEYFAEDEWAYGGASGGGASAIVMNENNSTILARARGGQGGNSSDWDTGFIIHGGAGRFGGGSNYAPGGTVDLTGGGCGGDITPLDGCNGQVVITYEIP